MPETRSKDVKKDSKRTNNKAAGGVGAPKKPQTKYVDPLRTKIFLDPMKQEVKRYEGNFKIPDYKPYLTYHEYTMPDIDPLTGKPRRKREARSKPDPEPKQPAKKPELHPHKFPPEVGNSVGSVKRSMNIMMSLEF